MRWSLLFLGELNFHVLEEKKKQHKGIFKPNLQQWIKVMLSLTSLMQAKICTDYRHQRNTDKSVRVNLFYNFWKHDLNIHRQTYSFMSQRDKVNLL